MVDHRRYPPEFINGSGGGLVSFETSALVLEQSAADQVAEHGRTVVQGRSLALLDSPGQGRQAELSHECGHIPAILPLAVGPVKGRQFRVIMDVPVKAK